MSPALTPRSLSNPNRNLLPESSTSVHLKREFFKLVQFIIACKVQKFLIFPSLQKWQQSMKKAVHEDSRVVGNIHIVFQNAVLLKVKLVSKQSGISVFQTLSAFQEQRGFGRCDCLLQVCLYSQNMVCHSCLGKENRIMFSSFYSC